MTNSQLVTFEVPFPDVDGHRKVHVDIGIAPKVGETVSVATKPDGHLGEFEVVGRKWRVAEEGSRPSNDETQVHVICELETVESHVD